jgi:hypothetical protein
MSDNSLFRDLTGERDPIWTECRTTPAVESATRVREWRVAVLDKCTLTHVMLLSGTVGADSGANGRLTKLKIWSCPSGGVLSGFVSKGYAQVTNGSAATLQGLRLHAVGVITFAAGAIIAPAVVTGTVARTGTKLGLCFTKGHRGA